MSAASPQSDPVEQTAQTAQAAQPGRSRHHGASRPLGPGEKPRPRTGPIVWGALVLVFCAYIASREMDHDAIDPTTWVITTIIGLGALLLIVGVVVLARGSRER